MWRVPSLLSRFPPRCVDFLLALEHFGEGRGLAGFVIFSSGLVTGIFENVIFAAQAVVGLVFVLVHGVKTRVLACGVVFLASREVRWMSCGVEWHPRLS